MNAHQMNQAQDTTNAVPFATELSDENLETLFGGLASARCGCGWICSYTGECTCTNGFTICWGPIEATR